MENIFVQFICIKYICIGVTIGYLQVIRLSGFGCKATVTETHPFISVYTLFYVSRFYSLFYLYSVTIR